MMLLALLLQAAPPPTPAPLPGAIGRQALPTRGCAAYLWSRGPEPVLVAMANAEPARVRLALNGTPVDLPGIAQGGGDAGYGFARSSEYRAGDATATLEMVLAPRPEMTDGAVVTDGVLTIVRPGVDTVILPVGGLVGCAPRPR